MKVKDFVSTPMLYHYTTFDNAIMFFLGNSLKLGIKQENINKPIPW